jgi:hypothetical protein
MIDPVTNNSSVSATGASNSTGAEAAALLAKLNSGIELEDLIERDSFLQRKVSMTLRKCNLDDRRRLMEAAVKKMKEAANDRINSAWLGSSLKVAAAVVSAYCACVSSAATASAEAGTKAAETAQAAKAAAEAAQAVKTANEWREAGAKVGEATAEGLSRYNPCDYSATMNDAKSKVLDQANAFEGERQKSNEDWLNSARELERKLIDRLEQMDRTEHETNLAAMGVR